MPRHLRPSGRTAIFDANSVLPLAGLYRGSAVVIPLPGGESVTGQVNLVQAEPNGIVRVGGGLTGAARGSFSLGSANGELAGRILLPDAQLAYVIATPNRGQLSMQETALGEVICERMPRLEVEAEAARAEPQAAPPLLSSRPSATAVLYLDFDGETVTDPDWNNGNTVIADPCGLSNTEITEVWNRVKEDYWPFNIDVTTNVTRYNNAPVGRRMRVIITPTDTVDPGAGGVAYVNSFALAGTPGTRNDIPCWVFNTSVVGIAESVSHELGHTLGLHHDGRTSPAEGYFAGQGSGATSWGPIMGAAYYQTIVQWSKGEYANANNPEDDLAIIASGTNGFGYVADEAGDTRGTALTLSLTGTSISQASGIITSAADVDFYTFTVASAKAVAITATPAAYSPDLDLQLELQDSAGNTLVSANPDGATAASISCNVTAGTYCVKIVGVGWGDPLTNGYSNYGSLGFYALTGSIVDGPEPVAPTITGQPTGVSVSPGDSASFTVTATGSSPLSFQWRKNGADLAEGYRFVGTRSTYLAISTVQAADAGDYTVVVRNAKGSATSNAATLVVVLPPPPTFSSQPYNTSVVEGNSLWLSGYASGTGTVTYQWYKDSQVLTGATATFLSISSVTSADAGVYQLTASNAGGTTWSQAAMVTVTTATPPVIVTQPQSQDLYLGQNISLGVYATSNGQITYQWYKNGTPIANSNTSNYYTSSSTATDAGLYTVVASTRGGSTTSMGAFVSVFSNLPPVITQQPNARVNVAIGSSYYLSVTASGMAPLTYQWYHNGVAMPGATMSSIWINGLTAADLGEYTVVVSNPNGTVTSTPSIVTVDPANAPGYFWRDARELDGVVYFLHLAPAKIARFDLGSGSWLDPWSLARAPTAFAFAGDAIYVAYGADVVRYDRNFSNGTPFCTAPASLGSLGVVGSYVVGLGAPSYSYCYAYSFSSASGNLAATTFVGYVNPQGFAVDPSGGRFWGRTGTAVVAVTVNSDGSMSQQTGGVYLSATSARMMFLPDGRVADPGGVVYDSSDLSYAGAFGTRLDDMVAAPAGGQLGLVGMRVFAFDTKYRRTASMSLGIPATRMWRKDDAIYAFAQPTALGGVTAVQRVDLSRLTSPAVAAAVSAQCRQVIPAKMVLDEEGVLYVSSKIDRNIFRWSTADHRYLPSIPLASAPDFLAYSPTVRTLYLDENGTQVRQVALDSGSFAAMPFASAPASLKGISGEDDGVFFCAPPVGDSSGTWHFTVSFSGDLLSHSESGFESAEYIWSAANRRIYGLVSGYLDYVPIDDSGRLGTSGSSSYINGITLTNPTRIAPDGSTVFVGMANLFAALQMTYLGSLPTMATDVAWTTGVLHVLDCSSTGAEVQSWPTSTYQLAHTVALGGRPLRLFALSGDRLLVVTSVNSYLNYWVLSGADLSVLSHDDTAVPWVPARPAYFDAGAYLSHNPDVAAAIGSVPDLADRAWQHYWLYGLNEGRSDGDFDPAAYLAEYPDLAASLGGDLHEAALQWYTTGRTEGRRIPAGFDVHGYLARYADLRGIYGSDLYGAWLHYLNYGVLEGRVFDTKFRAGEYPLLYGDLSALVNDPRGALGHWLNYGRAEGRLGRVPAGFDVASYLSRYPDLGAVFGSLPYPQRWVAAWEHYVNWGINEGRTDGDFDPWGYLNMYADLRAAFGNDWSLAAMHWYLYGRYEGRRIPAGFDARGYLARYEDLQVNIGDDLYGAWIHYLDWGVNEGRVFDELFRPDEYLAMYPDVRAACGTDRSKALLHWIYYGRYEGRRGRFP